MAPYLRFLLFAVVPGGIACSIAKRGGRDGGRMALFRRPGRGDSIRDAVVRRGGGRDRSPGDPEPLRGLRTGPPTGLYGVGTSLVAVPFLPGRNVGAGSRDLTVGPQNGS